METISALSNWRLRCRREGEGVTILRAATCDEDAVLPDELFGLPVTRLSDRCLAPGAAEVEGEDVLLVCGAPAADFDNRRIRRLTLPRPLKSIGDYAFLNLRAMETLCVYDALQGVGGACFMNCRAFSRLELTRSSGAQGPAMAAIVSALPQELTVTVHGDAEELRLVFPEYVERYEENSPARHFDFKIGGAGYPYHIVFRSRRLELADYDALFPGMLATEHEEDTALRLAFCRLRWPVGLSEKARGMYRAYLEKHRAETLLYALHTRDMEGLRPAHPGYGGAAPRPRTRGPDAGRAESSPGRGARRLVHRGRGPAARAAASPLPAADTRQMESVTNMENTENLSAVGRDILDSARTQLCMALPYLTPALCALAFAPGDGVTVSAATDGSAYYYYAPYLATLYLRSSGAVCRLYLHSVLHCLFRHLRGRRGKDAALWDLACDAAAESVLDSLALPCLAPVQTPIRKKFWGECRAQMKVLTAEGIYRMLLSERRPEYEIAQLSRAFSLDDHGLWDAEEKREREQSERQDKNWQRLANETQSAMGSFFAAEGTGGEAVTEQLSVAARDDVDYRKFLRRFAAPREVLKSDVDAFDYSYYSYGLRLYGNMPLIEPPETKEETRIEELVIAVDTSMSTSGELVRRFLENTYAVLRSTDTFTRRLDVHILQCDDQLRDDTRIRSANELRRYMAALPLTGGSATDFRPVFEHIEALQRAGQLKNLRGLLYFTDGMGIYPTRRPPYEVAFILLAEPPMALSMPRWAIRLVPELGDAGPVKQLDESVWIEEVLAELPEL